MVKERMDLLELMRKRGVDGDVDFLREALRVLVEEIMEADESSRTGAGYGERNPERVTQRNGYRSRAWDTRVGTMELQIPKLREGSYFPSLLEPRRRSERALLAVIRQAYVEGVSTRRVDDLVEALGCEGISKSQVSRICQELDGVVESFLGRPLGGGPYRHRLRRSRLAAVPHPLHDQPAHSGPQERSALGGQHGPHHLPAAVSAGGACPTRAGDCPAPGPVPTGRLSTGRGWTRRPGLLQLPTRPLEEDLVQQPPGASRQGDTAPHRCGGHLP